MVVERALPGFDLHRGPQVASGTWQPLPSPSTGLAFTIFFSLLLKSPPKELRRWGHGNELKAHFGGFLPQSIFAALSGLFVAPLKDSFVIGNFGPEYVVDNAGHFMRCGGRGLRDSEFGAHASEELPEVVLGSTKRVGPKT